MYNLWGSNSSFTGDYLTSSWHAGTTNTIFTGGRPSMSISNNLFVWPNIYMDEIRESEEPMRSTWKKNEYMLSTESTDELSIKEILNTVSAMQRRLTYELTNNALSGKNKKVDHIECYMTPEVKLRLVKASQKNSMFGKVQLTVANFDEYGRRLPDTIPTIYGMTVKIIDPDKYGPLHLALKGVYATKVSK